jgi:hypothetical protein
MEEYADPDISPVEPRTKLDLISRRLGLEK